MKQTAADIGNWAAIGGTMAGLAELLEAVPDAWGPAGPVIAAAGYLAVILTRRLVVPLEQLVEQGEARDEAIARVERDVRHMLWSRSTEPDADDRRAGEG